MPYIIDEERVEADDGVISTPGQINYLVFKYMKQNFTGYTSADLFKAMIDNISYYIHMTGQFYCHVEDLDKDFLKYLEDVFDKTMSNKEVSRHRFASAIQLAFDEFYRRVVAEYEDLKIKQNGDVQ